MACSDRGESYQMVTRSRKGAGRRRRRSVMQASIIPSVSALLTQVSFVTRDERVLGAAGLTGEEAVLQVDSLLWDGLRLP
jgi:hypothetical protein